MKHALLKSRANRLHLRIEEGIGDCRMGERYAGHRHRIKRFRKQWESDGLDVYRIASYAKKKSINFCVARGRHHGTSTAVWLYKERERERAPRKRNALVFAEHPGGLSQFQKAHPDVLQTQNKPCSIFGRLSRLPWPPSPSRLLLEGRRWGFSAWFPSTRAASSIDQSLLLCLPFGCPYVNL